MSKRKADLLSEMELRTVEHYRGNLSDACRLAGYSFPTVAAAKLSSRPRVIAALKEKESLLIKASV